MPTLTIRNVPSDLVVRLKTAARRNRRSMEEEVRALLLARYPLRADTIAELTARWQRLPPTSAREIDG